MLSQSLNIIEFIRHPELLNDQSHSDAQLAVLKSTYDLPLNSQEREIYQRATGRLEEVRAEQNEVTVIGGRRGGKTKKVGASIAVYEAFRVHHLSQGERGHVVLIAPAKYQAEIAMRYIRGYLLSSPILRKYVARIRRYEIDLTNGVSIVCYPCSYIAVRGVSIVCAICDELAFWRHEETDASPEEEVLAALRPAMATFPTAKMIKMSTPHRKEGILWREFQQRAELDHLVWQLSSAEMNPTISERVLEKARKDDETKFRREFSAEFTDDNAGWSAPEALDACIVHNRTELPRIENATYVVAVDPAFQHNDFALAVLHQTANGLVVDRVARWAGTSKVPLAYESVCEKIAQIAKEYGIREVVGDQYCAPVIEQFFAKLEIHYLVRTFDAHTRADLFGNLRHLIVQGKIELLDDPILLRQLRALEARQTSNGNTDIRPTYGNKDDVAVTVALAAFELTGRPPQVAPWAEYIFTGSPSKGSLASQGSLGGGWTRIGYGDSD